MLSMLIGVAMIVAGIVVGVIAESLGVGLFIGAFGVFAIWSWWTGKKQDYEMYIKEKADEAAFQREQALRRLAEKQEENSETDD